MKLKKLMIPMALVLGGVMVGCESKDETEQTLVKEVAMENVKSELLNSGLFGEVAMGDIPAKDHFAFESIQDKIEDGFVIHAMMNVKLREVFFVKTTDVDAVEKAILDYKEGNLELFSNGYGGEDNATAVADAKINKVGNYVYFIATPNSDEVEAKLLELIK